MSRRSRTQIRTLAHAAIAAVACLAAAGAVQAQSVHKCTVNGQVTYQAAPCAAGEAPVTLPPGPSTQEQQDARADASRQRYEADSGVLVRKRASAKRAQRADGGRSYEPPVADHMIVDDRSAWGQPAPAPVVGADACSQINARYREAMDRRDAMKAPGELADRQAKLQKATDDADRAVAEGVAAHCKLTR